jgi:hypothetical protein
LSRGSQAARKACQESCQPLTNDRGQVAEQERERGPRVLAVARCLRTHGVPDFPDPTVQGQLTKEMVTAARIDLQAPAVLAAAKICLPKANGAITAPTDRAGR